MYVDPHVCKTLSCQINKYEVMNYMYLQNIIYIKVFMYIFGEWGRGI